MDFLGIRQFVLGGLSMGGQIVLEMYWQAPDRIQALLLADTFAGLDSAERRQDRFTTADRLEREGMATFAREELGKMAAALRGRAQRVDYLPVLKKIHVPTLIAVGRKDPVRFTPEAWIRLELQSCQGPRASASVEALTSRQRSAGLSRATGSIRLRGESTMKPKRYFSDDILAILGKSKGLRIRAGTGQHRFIGIWVVVVKGRVFVRSWSVKPKGWYRTFLKEPRGTIQVADSEIAVRALSIRNEHLRDAVDLAYLAKYNTAGALKYAKDLGRAKSRATTIELVPLS